MEDKEKIEIFENVFRSGIGHSRFQCSCGKEFFNSDGGWDWEDGELEKLEQSDAIDLDYTVGTVRFEGVEYSIDCDCWHKRALQIFNFLMFHNSQIIELFKSVKNAKQKEVDAIETGIVA